MKRIVALAGLILALGCLPFSAFALGLGTIHLHSALGQKLDADISLVGVDSQSAAALKVGLASPDAFEQAGVRRTAILQSLEFNVVSGADGYRVHVVSDQPVKEPFLTFLVVAHWPSGQMLRQYTVLLDPPNYAGGAAAAAPVDSANESGTSSRAPARGTSTRNGPSVSANTRSSSGSMGSVGSIPAAGSNYGPIQRGETLWGIANRLTDGDPTQTNQVMVAIYRANPRAFSGNINRMKAGHSLRIPGRASINAISPREAIAAVKSANQRFKASRIQQSPGTQEVASGMPDNAASEAEADTGSNTNADTDTGAGGGSESGDIADSGGHLQLVAPDADADGNQTAPGDGDVAAAVAARTAQLKEQLETAREQADQATDRNAELAGQVDDLKQELKETKHSLSVTDQQLSQLQNQARQRNQAGTTGGSSIDRIISFVTSSAFLIGLLVVLVLVVAGVVIWRRQRTEAKPQSRGRSAAVAAIAAGDGDTDESGPEVPSEPTIEDDEDESEPSGDEQSSDPISEADFNIDYGLYDQAAEVIRKGIAADPERDELKLKLFQIYFDSGDAVGFRAAAQEFASDWGADHPAEWAEVTAMGQQLAPDEPLFASDSDKAEMDAAADAGAAAQAAGTSGTETEMPTEVATEVGVDTQTDLSADLAAELDTELPDDGPAEPEPEETIADPRDEALDFDLDMDEPASEPEARTDVSGLDERPAEVDLSALETELNPDAKAAEEGAENPLLDTQTEFEDAIRELSEFVDTSLPDEEGDEPNADPAPAGTSETTSSEEAEAGFTAAPAALDAEDDAFADDDDVDEMDTKLDLAKAYMDMGDPEGARGILEEVIEEGAASHQEQARSLLEQVG